MLGSEWQKESSGLRGDTIQREIVKPKCDTKSRKITSRVL